MGHLSTAIDTSSENFRRNAAVNRALAEQLRMRVARNIARRPGADPRPLLPRERVERLLDPDATVKGGVYFPVTIKKHLRAQEIALENWLGIIGSASSAVQIISELVDQVGHLTVFARTPKPRDSSGLYISLVKARERSDRHSNLSD